MSTAKRSPVLVLPWDPYASQSESPVPYRYEGEGRGDVTSRAGSPLSSLNDSQGDSEVDLGLLFHRLGRPFRYDFETILND
jgi:hypothetical protein